jgi:hypothetical protein
VAVVPRVLVALVVLVVVCVVSPEHGVPHLA